MSPRACRCPCAACSNLLCQLPPTSCEIFTVLWGRIALKGMPCHDWGHASVAGQEKQIAPPHRPSTVSCRDDVKTWRSQAWKRPSWHACRLKDAPAQALYERAGYAPVQKDNVLVLLLGQDRRFLMRKRLTPGLTPGSA